MWNNDVYLGPSRFASSGTGDPWEKRTKAFWSIKWNSVAIIYIHGWTGDAIGTWARFLTLWPSKWEGCDHIFYGYDSSRSQADEHAGYFREFLKTFLSNPSSMINSSNAFFGPRRDLYLRPDDFSYKQVVIVAHSLGALVARRALLDSRMPRTQFVLFAPAHNGSPWAKQSQTPGSCLAKAIINGVSVFAIPSVLSLDPDCKFLRTLESDTNEAFVNGQREPIVASRTVFPQREYVVISGPFGKDFAREKPFTGHNHMNICKPKDGWLDPIDLVLKVL